MSRQIMPAELEGKLVLVLDHDEAQTLARVLAHYEALTHPVDGNVVPTADGYDPDVWHQVLIGLLHQAAVADIAADLGVEAQPAPAGVSG